jgi:hypothetical protein
MARSTRWIGYRGAWRVVLRRGKRRISRKGFAEAGGVVGEPAQYSVGDF